MRWAYWWCCNPGHNQGNGQVELFPTSTLVSVWLVNLNVRDYRSLPFPSSRQELVKIVKHSEYVGGRIDLLRDIFICASSLSCCTLMEKPLKQTEGAKCSLCPGYTKKIYRSATSSNILCSSVVLSLQVKDVNQTSLTFAYNMNECAFHNEDARQVISFHPRSHGSQIHNGNSRANSVQRCALFPSDGTAVLS